jgi:Fe2+ or Zn2+ uptake regulation protein
VSGHAEAVLKGKGYRLTRQRRAIWEILRSRGGHLSAEEILEALVERFPGVNLSTVYRNLEVLRREGLVRETGLGHRHRHYEVGPEHHHLVCRGCGKVVHLPAEEIPSARRLAWAHGFEVEETSLTVFGICPECKGG